MLINLLPQRIAGWLRQAFGYNPRVLSFRPGAADWIAAATAPASHQPGGSAPPGSIEPASRAAPARPPAATATARGNGTQLSDTGRRATLMAVFNSARPVAVLEHLYGRQEQLDLLRETVLEQQQHALIYGARGSGKTSLIRMFGEEADNHGTTVIYLACDEQQSFAGLFRPYLDELAAEGWALTPQQVQRLGDTFGPRDLVSVMADCRRPVILVLDEFDRVSDLALRADVAMLMKLLSDAMSPVRLVIVGIARTAVEIIGHHSSLRRHMVCIPIGRISRDSGNALLEAGAEAAGMSFSKEAADDVLTIACGSPFHIRLFALHAGLEAVRRGEACIDLSASRDGTSIAHRRWAMIDPSASDQFIAMLDKDGTRATILPCVAMIAATRDGFSPDDVRSALPEVTAAEVDDAITALGSTLELLEEDPLYYQFQDSLAPQFLLLIASRRRAIPTLGSKVISLREHAA